MASLANNYRVFISHGSPDRWIAKQIRKLLNEKDVSCFLDDADVSIGENFRSAILHELQICDEVLVLLTPSSINRAWVFAEIGAAILSQKRVVPIRYGVTMEELHERGVVSLVGDVAPIDLDHLDEYVVAVASRSGGHSNV